MTIKKLPVKNKRKDGQKLMLVEPPFDRCHHYGASFEVDLDAGKCFCKQCNDEVSAMFVLNQLMESESRWHRTRENYINEMERLKKRSRTKCQHCFKITRISGR